MDDFFVWDLRNIFVWLEMCRGYLDTAERHLECEPDAFREWTAGVWVPPGEAEMYRLALEEFYPNMLRSSFFAYLYSWTEHELNDCYNHMRDYYREATGKLLKPLQEIRGAGQGAARAWKALTEEARLTPPSGSEGLRREIVHDYRDLRNHVVHYPLVPPGPEDKKAHERFVRLKQEYVPRKNGLLTIRHEELQGVEYVVFRRGFCEQAVSSIRGFFEMLELDAPTARQVT